MKQTYFVKKCMRHSSWQCGLTKNYVTFAEHVFMHTQNSSLNIHGLHFDSIIYPRFYAYLVVLGVGVWEGVLVAGGLEGGQEEGLVEGLGVDLVEVQEAEDEALVPSCLQAYQEASRTEERLEITGFSQNEA